MMSATSTLFQSNGGHNHHNHMQQQQQQQYPVPSSSGQQQQRKTFGDSATSVGSTTVRTGTDGQSTIGTGHTTVMNVGAGGYETKDLSTAIDELLNHHVATSLHTLSTRNQSINEVIRIFSLVISSLLGSNLFLLFSLLFCLFLSLFILLSIGL